MSNSVGDVFLDLKLNKKPFERGMEETKSSGTRAASLIGSKMGLAIAGAIGGAVATIGFGSLISKTTKVGDAVDKMSQKLGMSSQTYQEWDYVMQRCGASMDSMTTAMKTLASSAETSKDALAQLGISEEEVATLSQEQLFARVIQQLQGVEDTTRRTYLAGQLLGRGATELGALLNMSAQDTTALRGNLTELGGVMSQTAVSNAAALADAMTDVRMAFHGIYNVVAETILPIVTKAINNILIPIVLRGVAVVKYFGSVFSSVFGLVKKKSTNVTGAFSGIKTEGIGAAKSLGKISKGTGGVGKAAKKTKKAVKELNRELMGFDKMNKLSKKQKDQGDTGAGSGGKAGSIGGGGGVSGGGFGGLDDAVTDEKKPRKLGKIWKALGGIFAALVRLFKAVVKALAPIGKWLWEHLIKPFGKLIGMAIIAVLEGIAGAIELLAVFVEKHPKLAAILMGIGTALLLIMKRAAIIGFLKKFGAAFRLLGGAIMAHPIALLLIAIALAIGYIYKHWDKIKKTKFGKILIKVGNALKNVYQIVKEKLLAAFEKAKPVLVKIGSIFKKLGSLYIKAVVTYFKVLWKVIKVVARILKVVGKVIWKSIVIRFKILAKVISVVIQAVKAIAKWFGGKLKKAIKTVAKILGKFADTWKSIKSKKATITSKLAGAKEKVITDLGNAWGNIKTKTSKLTATLAGTKEKAFNSMKKIWAGFKSKGAKLTTTLANKISTAKNAVINKLKSAWGTVKTKAATLTTSLANKIATGKNSALSKVQSAWGSLKSKTAKLTASLAGAAVSTFTKLKDAWGKIKDKTAKLKVDITTKLQKGWNSIVDKLRNSKIGVIKKFGNGLPRFAQGGWVDKNTPQLAMIGDNRHEAEIVAPDSKLAAMARQAAQEAAQNSSNAQVIALLTQLLRAVNAIDTNVYLDGKQIADSTVKQINRQTRTTGTSPLLV